MQVQFGSVFHITQPLQETEAEAFLAAAGDLSLEVANDAFKHGSLVPLPQSDSNLRIRIRVADGDDQRVADALTAAGINFDKRG